MGSDVAVQYTNEIINMGEWVMVNEPSWFTEYGRQKHREVVRKRTGELYREYRRRIKATYAEMFREAKEEPIYDVEVITAKRFMEYLGSQGHFSLGRFLKVGSYGMKRSALNHLFRVHNGYGFPKRFSDELSMLWSGFRRLLVQRVGAGGGSRVGGERRRGNRQENEPTAEENKDEEDDDSVESLVEDEEDDRDDFKEGKEPMSPELLECVCRWSLEWGTQEGVFLACFCLWTWNLVCRGHNTARIRLSHMSWAEKFDCLGVHFKHMKNDQKGKRRTINGTSSPIPSSHTLTFVS